MKNEDLMLRYRDGDQKAFDELFERIQQRVYAYVSKHLFSKNEVEDVTQNIFVKLHTTKEKYDPKHPFEAWLFVIARSVLYDHLRKSSKINLDELKTFLTAEEPEINLEDSLKKLSEKSRTIVEMKYLEDLSFEEIAQKVESTPANIRQIISRSLRLLRRNNEVKDE